MARWPGVFTKTKLRLLSCLFLWVVVLTLGLGNRADAGFLSQFSLSASEEYNDNITFTDKTTADFVTGIKPAIGLFYKPFGEDAATFTAVVETHGQIFARNSSFNNFGKNTSFGTAYIHRQSPKLNFYFSNTLVRVGETRTQSVRPDRRTDLGLLPSEFPTSGAPLPLPLTASSAGLVATGNAFGNFFSARTSYQYRPKITFTGEVSVHYLDFLDEGGIESSQGIRTRAIYKWGEKHNFHLGIGVRNIRSRNGDDELVIDLDLGNDTVTRFDFQLTPTLKLSYGSGVSFGPAIVNRSSISLEQIWKKARLIAGLRHGLTNSLGVSGTSRTTTVFGDFNMQFTRSLSGDLEAIFSNFDTDDGSFNTLRANAGLEYWVLYWLRADLKYSYSMRNGGAGSSDSIVTGVNENPRSNSVFLRFTARFDAYPKFGFAKWIPFRER